MTAISEPLIVANALAEVTRRVMTRPSYLSDLPLVIDEDLWHRAREEMAEVLRARGFSALSRANLSEDNFLLHGTAIVRGS